MAKSKKAKRQKPKPKVPPLLTTIAQVYYGDIPPRHRPKLKHY